MGCRWKGTSPKWAGRQTPLGPMCLGFGGGNPKGGAPLLGGQAPSPCPPSRSHLEEAGPPSPSPINRGAKGELHHHIQDATPPLSNTSPPPRELGEALLENCHSITTTPSCCCWSSLPQPPPPPCWIKARETSPGRTCVERGGAVRSVLDHR